VIGDSGGTLPITSDNLHLSEVIQDCSTPNGALRNPLSLAGCTDPKILQFVTAATASSTRRAYDSDLRQYLSWGGQCPATPEHIARYLADHAGLLASATLARRLVAIRSAHIARGLSDPTKSEIVRLTFRGIRRKHGRPQRRVAALGPDDLLSILGTFGDSVRDIRDAAILLVGFAGAFRRSELAGIDCDDIEISERGTLITISRGKTDQESHGRLVPIPRMPGSLCPVAALERWLRVARISEGPVFRPVTKGAKVQPIRISAESIASILKRRVQAIGRDAARYSGHSLRAGFVTAAAGIGAPAWRIRIQTGHLSDAMLERYIREGHPSSADVVKMVCASVAGRLSNGSQP
jgi:integrase